MTKKLKIGVDKRKNVCYNTSSGKVHTYVWTNAGVAELADARDLKSRELIPRAGSIPVSGTKTTNLISRGRAARLARRAHNPEVRRFKSPPRNQKRKQSIGLLFRFWNDVFRKRNVMRTSCVMTASPCDVRFASEKEHNTSLRPS